MKLKSNPSNPAYECVFKPKYEALYKKKKKIKEPFGIRNSQCMKDLGVNMNLIETFRFPRFPPWNFETTVDWQLSENIKSSTDPGLFRAEHRRIKGKYRGYKHLYTDGSKSGEKVAAAAVRWDMAIGYVRLPDNATIFTAELEAIAIALNFINRVSYDRFLIFSDSKSSLQALEGDDWRNPYVLRCKERLYYAQNTTRKKVIFVWIPSHTGIKGNDEADAAAKEALNEDENTEMKIPYSDFECLIHPYIREKWQVLWDNDNTKKPNKLHSIFPTIGDWPQSYRDSRREEIVLTRLRIGHSRLTHSHLMKREPPPECVSCQCELTIEHILIDCVEFTNIRAKYYDVPDLKTLFDTISPEEIFDFLKEIGLFYKI